FAQQSGKRVVVLDQKQLQRVLHVAAPFGARGPSRAGLPRNGCFLILNGDRWSVLSRSPHPAGCSPNAPRSVRPRRALNLESRIAAVLLRGTAGLLFSRAISPNGIQRRAIGRPERQERRLAGAGFVRGSSAMGGRVPFGA